jgi:hypothetical protein
MFKGGGTMNFILKVTNLKTRKVFIWISNKNDPEDLGQSCGGKIAKAIERFGKENFEKEVLEKGKDLEGRKQYWIRYYKSDDPYKGYNVGTGQDDSEVQDSRDIEKEWFEVENELCRDCVKDCKQSDKVDLLFCPQREEKNNERRDAGKGVQSDD